MKLFNRKKKLFTLIELIIVIIVLAILSGLALPKFLGVTKNSRVAAMQRDLEAIESAVNLYELENNELPLKTTNMADTLNESILYSLNKIGDNGSEVYEIDFNKLNNNLEKIKYKEDTYLYSTISKTAISLQGKVDGKDNIYHLLNSGVSSEKVEQLQNTWHKVMGGSGYEIFTSVIETSDNCFVAVGYTTSKDGEFSSLKSSLNTLIVKFDKYGNIIWNNVLGGSSLESFTSVIETSDGNLIAVGYTASIDGDFGTSKGYNDTLIVKFDKNGKILWNKVLGGTNYETFSSVIETTDNCYVAVGETSSTNGDFKASKNYNNDTLIVKFDKDGKMLWNKVLGGTNSDIFYSVIEISDGNLIAVGCMGSKNGDFSPANGNYDALIVNFNKDGDVLWYKVMGGNDYDFFKSATKTFDGGFVVAGWTSSTKGDFNSSKSKNDALIVKYDKDGKMLWNKVVSGNSNDEFKSVIETSDGNLIAIGYTSSTNGDFKSSNGNYDSLIVKFDKNGKMIWHNVLGGTNYETFCSVIETTDKGYISVGNTSSTDGDFEPCKGEGSALIVKFNELGQF